MSIGKIKRISLLLLGIMSALVVVTLSVIWIQREIRWKNTRREMDVFEQDILQKIVITEDERLPSEMIEALFTAIMAADAEVDNQYIPEFVALTEEFLKRINSQMNLSLKPEDLNALSTVKKSDFDKYGNEITIAYYQFNIGEETFHYSYYMNNKLTKVINMGTARVNRVLIANENNLKLSAVYSEWKSKYSAYFSKPVYIEDYYKFIKLWEKGNLPDGINLTIKNIQKVNQY